jgi:two-component system, OmpR family, alkaline phosphatase synthesis response regulator PhoP
MKSILLVEDDPFIVDIYTTKLKQAGFNVDTAQDGKTAIEKLEEKKPDLVVLDIVLPQVDG